MARQIEPRLGEPRLATLDHRVGVLEARVAALADALQALARGLEAAPSGDEREDGPVAVAARRASELITALRRGRR
jgi:hypothetical protein